jgi:DNA-binding GntR family transcriptional regulator
MSPLIQPRQAQRLQLEKILRQRIVSGHYATGSFLPSQTELVEEFGVHAGAVRDALNALIREHTCVRLKGQGVMVRQVKHLRHFFHSLTPIEDEQRESGNDVSTRTLSTSTVQATAAQQATYPLPPNTPLLRQRRVVSVNGNDYQVVDSYYPLKRYPDLETVLSGDQPAYQRLREHYGVQPSSLHKTLEAVVLSPEVCTILNIKRRSVGSIVTGHITDDAGQLILFWESQTPGESLILHHTLSL